MTTTTLPLPSTPRATHPRLATSSRVIARRALLRFLRTPQLLLVGTATGAMFLLIFRYVFGGAVGLPGIRYVDFLVPGYVAATVLFAGMGTATAVAEDLEQGVVDRVRSLPIPRGAFLAGRAWADTAVLVWTLAVTVAIGFAVGFRVHGGLLDAFLAFGLVTVYGFAFIWLFIVLGLVARTAQAAQGLGFLVFPLSFVSSAYVPVESMPGWMQAFAEHQPLTAMTNAVRALTQGPAAEALLGHTAGYFVVRSLLWATAIVAVFAPLAVLRYRRG